MILDVGQIQATAGALWSQVLVEEHSTEWQEQGGEDLSKEQEPQNPQWTEHQPDSSSTHTWVLIAMIHDELGTSWTVAPSTLGSSQPSPYL